ncbi:MAG: ArsR/SmtB family transcription factor [Ktedonobacterales bacterium]
MDTDIDARPATQQTTQPLRAVDLRRGRAPDVEVLACATYDFLLSMHVALASPDYDYADFAIGREWIESARARCNAHAPGTLDVLGRYLGNGRPGSLHGTLISLVAQCPEPRDTQHFLQWIEALPVEQIAEVLLDQKGLGDNWRDLLLAALAEHQHPADEAASHSLTSPTVQLLDRYPEDLRPTVATVLRQPEQARAELLAALRAWDEAVFAQEAPRITPLLRREAAVLERQRAEMPIDRFVKMCMHGVEWQRPATLRRIIFAPSYFCRPAVYYHFWHDTLTFCTPVEAGVLAPDAQRTDPRAPGEEILDFFEALGDKTRLRILRLLSEREMYLTELAEQLGLTKATTKHHMVCLRAAGLVTLYDRDRMTFYALRPDITRRSTQLLDGYLFRPVEA